MLTRLVRLMIGIGILAAAAAAEADCPINIVLGAIASNGDQTVTANTQGECGGSTIKLALDGGQLFFKDCSNPATPDVSPNCSGSGIIHRGCLTNGEHTLHADAMCSHAGTDTNGQPSCTPEPQPTHKEQSFVVSNPPTSNLSVTGPDALGRVTATITYTLGDYRDFGFVRLNVLEPDGHLATQETTVFQPSGSVTYNYNTVCKGQGNYVFGGTVLVCGGLSPTTYPSDPGFIATDQKTVALNAQTTVSGSYTPATSDNGSDLLTINYNFPNTDSTTQRHLSILVDGHAPQGVGCGELISGVCTVSLGLACGSGTHQITLIANACGRSDPMYNATNVTDATAAECKRAVTQCQEKPTSFNTLDAMTADAGNSCPSPCVAAPIHTGSGDVSVSLHLFTIAADPLPLPFDLTFHSAVPVNPSLRTQPFGTGWTHTYNQYLRAAGNRLDLQTATGDHVLFDKGPDNVWRAGAPKSIRDTVVIENGQYVLKSLSGSKSVFDLTTGRWLSTSDRWGNTISGSYDGSGNLATISDTAGRQVTLIYSGIRIDRIVLPNGATWRFEYLFNQPYPMPIENIYDPAHPEVAWRHFTYGNSFGGGWNLLQTMTDSGGKTLEAHTYENTDFPRGLVSAIEGGRDFTQVEYNTPAAGQTRVTRTLNSTMKQVTGYTLDYKGGMFLPTQIDGICSSCGVATDSQLLTFDANGNVTSRTDALGHVTNFAYDANSALTSKSEAVGTAQQRTTQYFHEQANWPTFTTKRIEPAANGLRTTTVTWNANETLLTFATDGKLTSDPATRTILTSTSTFDSRHRLVASDGPRTDVADVTTRVFYPDDDSITNRRGRIQRVTNAVGLTSTFDDYDLYGTARSTTDANSVVNAAQTDLRGRVTSSTNKAVVGDPNEATDYTMTSAYDNRDRLIETVSPRGTRTRYGYEDGTNRLIDTIRKDATGIEIERRHVTLDLFGNKTKEEDQVCASPAPTCGSWITKRSESYVYDDRQRLIEVDHTTPAGSKVVYHYDADGQLANVQDENHSAPNTTYGYDALHRLTSVVQTLAPGSITTRYAYDAADDLTGVTDPNGNLTSYGYDDFGRMQLQSSPVTGSTSYVYDAAGDLTSSTDANGATSMRVYDAMGRMTSTTSSRAGATETVTYTYDDPSSGNYGRGRVASMSDPTGSTTYRYERRGLLASEVKTIEGTPYATAFGYDANGNRKSMIYPSGRTISYTFDFADRPFSASTGSTVLVSSASYRPFGPLTQMVFGNGTTKTMQYDDRYRPTENKLTGPAGTIADYVYQEDAAGNITQIHDAVDPSYNRDFGYDDLNRLITANSGASLWGAGSYSYDAMGNMLALSLGNSRTASFAYSGSTPKLTSVTENGTTRSVTYDAAGNELAVQSSTYTYSPRNHLTQADGAIYTYDGRGIRTITAFAPRLNAFTIDPASVVGGSPATGTLSLEAPALAGGQTITMSTNSPAVTVPPSVVIPEGSSSTTATISTHPTASTASATITASDGTASRSAVLSVLPPKVIALVLDPAELTGGANATATVTLDGAAPQGGVTVTIGGATSFVTSPASVTVPEGMVKTSFVVATSPVATAQAVTMTASANAGSANALLTVDPPVPVALTIQPPSVNAGGNAQATVTLSGVAPAAGITVTLTSDRAEATVPSSIVIAGTSTGTFTINTSSVSQAVTAHISASANGSSTSATLTVNPPPVALSNVNVTPGSVIGGLPATGTVTLTGPAPPGGALVTLLSDDASIASVPSSVTVQQGSSSVSFAIETTTLVTPATVGITASYNGVSQTAALTVMPPPNPAILSLTVDPVNVAGGSSATGTVTLTAPAPSGGADVTLLSENAAVAFVPSHVVVRKNDTTATFTITTAAVAATQSVRLSGTYGGLTQRDMLTVIPPTAIQLVSLSISPTSVPGGGTATGTVTMSTAAPPGGLTVSIICKRRNVATVPATVLVPSGSSSATFTINAQLVKSTHAVDITATYAGVTKVASLTVTKQTATMFSRRTPLVLSVTATVATTATNATRRYSFYTPELHLMAESENTYGDTPGIAYEYVWFGGRPIAQIETMANAFHYYFTDHLGLPLLTTSSAAGVDWRVDREPYGTRLVVSSNRYQPLSFPGQEEEPSSFSRSYNIFRWYRSSWGRYTSADPIGLRGGINQYAYTFDNPIRWTDPTGTCVCVFKFNVGRLTVAANCKGKLPIWVVDEGNKPAAPAVAGTTVSADGFVLGGVLYKIDGSTCVEFDCSGSGFTMSTCVNGLACLRGKKEPYPVPWGEFGGPPKEPPSGAYPPVAK